MISKLTGVQLAFLSIHFFSIGDCCSGGVLLESLLTLWLAGDNPAEDVLLCICREECEVSAFFEDSVTNIRLLTMEDKIEYNKLHALLRQ